MYKAKIKSDFKKTCRKKKVRQRWFLTMTWETGAQDAGVRGERSPGSSFTRKNELFRSHSLWPRLWGEHSFLFANSTSFIICGVFNYTTIFLLSLKAVTFLQTTKLGSKQQWVNVLLQKGLSMGRRREISGRLLLTSYSTLIMVPVWIFLTPFIRGDQKQLYLTHWNLQISAKRWDLLYICINATNSYTWQHVIFYPKKMKA